MHIPSSYAKILGETNFQHRENPRSGSKAKDGKERKKERKREKKAKVGNNNGQLHIANATSGGARNPPGPKYVHFFCELSLYVNAAICKIIGLEFTILSVTTGNLFMI